MKERPIIFDAESVRAILDGTKTQTRRVIKPQPDHFHLFSDHIMRPQIGQTEIKCPYGWAGDRLWVREGWRLWGWDEDFDGASIGYCADDGYLWRESPDSDGWESWMLREIERFSRLPGVTLEDEQYEICDERAIPWRSPIHMPRWASRITLEITGVRVERLQDITFDDALAEGIETDIWDQAFVSRDYSGQDKWFESWGLEDSEQTTYVDVESIPQASFRSRWDAINGKRAPWASNPWVWVVEFRRVKP